MYDIDLMPDFLDEERSQPSNAVGRINNADMAYLDFTKPISKAELAERLGISSRTLRKWLHAIDAESIPGYRKRGKIITPGVMRVLAERFCL